jgi:hypothetical protein
LFNTKKGSFPSTFTGHTTLVTIIMMVNSQSTFSSLEKLSEFEVPGSSLGTVGLQDFHYFRQPLNADIATGHDHFLISDILTSTVRFIDSET